MTESSGGCPRLRLPHDPHEMGQPCPECNEPWPCAERRRQRAEKKALERYMRSALYEPTGPRPSIDGYEAVRWQSPLDWYADLTYGLQGVVMVVHTPGGDVRSDNAYVEWLDEVLP